MCHTWEHRNDTPFHMCMQAGYAKTNRGRRTKKKKKDKEKREGAKKKEEKYTVSQRLRRSNYRCADARTSTSRRVRKTATQVLPPPDLLRLRRVKKNRAFRWKWNSVFVKKKRGEKKKRNGAERRPEHKNKRVSQKKDFEESSVRDRALKFLLKRSTITCNSSRSSRSEKFLRWSSLKLFNYLLR